MKFKIKDMDIATGGPLVVVVNSKDAKAADLHQGDRIALKYKHRSAIAIVNFAESEKAVPFGHIGCYEEVLVKLGVRSNWEVSVTLEEKPRSVQYIKEKLNGKKLTYPQIYEIIKDITENKLSDIELTYFVSACHLNAMTMQETIDLTRAMIRTGQVLHVKRKPVIDKHCVGGVAGNRTTMVVVPILAAAGITVPKTSSRSITSPAGTADTMEVLANVSFPLHKMKAIVDKIGACLVWGGAINLAPADDRIIRVEHPLSIDSRSQLLASIIAKKASVSATHVLVDIPIGRGAKIDDIKKARILKSQFEIIGRSVGIEIKVIITDGSQPIGNGLGPALEARDVLWLLKGDSRAPKDLLEKSVAMAGLSLEIAGKARRGAGKKKALQLLKSGKAYSKMLQIIKAQGGKSIGPDKIQVGRFTYDCKSQKNGRIEHIDNMAISKIARAAGAPRDKGSGIYLLHHKGDKVRNGDVLYTVYAENEQRMEFAKNVMKDDIGVEIK